MYKVYTNNCILGSIKLTTSEDNGWDFAKPELSLNKFSRKYVYIKFNQIYVDTPTKEIQRCVNKLQNEILITAIRKYFPTIPKEYDRIKSFQYVIPGKDNFYKRILIDCTTSSYA